MLEWIQNNTPVLWWLTASSIVTFLLGFVAAPWWVIRLPADYFMRQQSDGSETASAENIFLKLGRNLLGGFFMAGGLLMLVLPGQGVLLILIGLMLTDFPGKHRIAKWLVARPPVLHSLNWMRRRANRPPLIVDN